MDSSGTETSDSAVDGIGTNTDDGSVTTSHAVCASNSGIVEENNCNDDMVKKATNHALSCHGNQKTFDHLDIRVGLFPIKWKNIINVQNRKYHESIVFPCANGANYNLIAIGGSVCGSAHRADRLKSVQSLQLFSHNPSLGQPTLPDMNVAREDFGAIFLEGKVYLIGGEDTGDTFEILELNNIQAGWSLHRQSPVYLSNTIYCKAVTVGNRYIFTLFSTRTKSVFCSYDTKLCTWNHGLQTCKYRYRGFGMASISIPGEGSYVVVVGSRWTPHSKCVEAYHAELQTWLQLPSLPDAGRSYGTVTTIGNRYVLVAGGIDTYKNIPISSTLVLDWEGKQWYKCPSLQEARSAASGAFVPSPLNRLVIVGGSKSDIRTYEFVDTIGLNISSGIGWTKEKLLLLCFSGKAHRAEDKSQMCLLEGLPSGVFATILKFLLVPFQNEIEAKGSIFGGIMMDSSFILGNKDMLVDH